MAAKDFKNSSVKKLLLLSVYPEVPEVHDNLKKILEDLNIEAIDFLVSADIKMRKLLIVVTATEFGLFCSIGQWGSAFMYRVFWSERSPLLFSDKDFA